MTSRDQGTIVVLASNGFVVRNYLLGKCAEELRAASRVLTLSHLHSDTEFVRAMSGRGIEVGPLFIAERSSAWTRVRRWRDALHVARIDTTTWRMKRSRVTLALPQRVIGRLVRGVAEAAASESMLRRLDRAEERHALATSAADKYRRLFEEARASVVFSAAPLNADEWLPVQVARSMGIPTVLSILSWDNLSSKSRIPLPVDAVLVWGEAMREEMREFYSSYPAERVHVTGAPQFEFYLEQQRLWSRVRFCEQIGLDPSRPIIVYGGVTEAIMPNEPRVVAGLATALRAGEIKGNPQLLLRLHPKDDGERYASFRLDFPEVRIMTPGARNRGDVRAWQPTDEDVTELVNTMHHGDVHLNVASTMTIDAAVADRPVINIAYDLRDPGEQPAWGICGYEFTHYAPVVKTGGVRVVRSQDELLHEIKLYLADPRRDAVGRKRIVELECGPLDGRAGQRVARHLLAAARVPRVQVA